MGVGMSLWGASHFPPLLENLILMDKAGKSLTGLLGTPVIKSEVAAVACARTALVTVPVPQCLGVVQPSAQADPPHSGPRGL